MLVHYFSKALKAYKTLHSFTVIVCLPVLLELEVYLLPAKEHAALFWSCVKYMAFLEFTSEMFQDIACVSTLLWNYHSTAIATNTDTLWAASFPLPPTEDLNNPVSLLWLRIDFNVSFGGFWAGPHHGLPSRLRADPRCYTRRLILSRLWWLVWFMAGEVAFVPLLTCWMKLFIGWWNKFHNRTAEANYRQREPCLWEIGAIWSFVFPSSYIRKETSLLGDDSRVLLTSRTHSQALAK